MSGVITEPCLGRRLSGAECLTFKAGWLGTKVGGYLALLSESDELSQSPCRDDSTS